MASQCLRSRPTLPGTSGMDSSLKHSEFRPGKFPKKWLFKIFSLLLLVFPFIICLCNADSCTDWGDDFAQYLCQASVIAGNMQQLPVTCINSYSPEVKGVLFSNLLVPLLGTSSLILNCKLMTSIFLGMFGCLIFRFLIQNTNIFAAWLLTIFLVSHIQTIELATQILPDILFAFTTLLAIYLYLKKFQVSQLSALFLSGFSVGLKSAGFVLLFVLLAHTLLSAYKGHFSIRTMLIRVILIFLCPLLMKIVYGVYFDVESTSMWYIHQSINNFSFNSLVESIIVYYNSFKSIFEFEVPAIINNLIIFIVGFLFLIGFVNALFRNSSVIELFLLSYLMLLLVYPDYNETYRFLFPVLPLLLWYMLKAINLLTEKLFLISSGNLVTGFAILLLIANFNTLRIQRPSGSSICDTDAVELFQFLKHTISKDKIISCEKPWAIAWFGQVQTMPNSCIARKADYLLLNNSNLMSQPGFNDDISFENNSFVLVKL